MAKDINAKNKQIDIHSKSAISNRFDFLSEFAYDIPICEIHYYNKDQILI